MKPIIETFKAAKAIGRLTNELRDTLGYTALAIYEFSDGLSEEATKDFLFWGVQRELFRMFAWHSGKDATAYDGHRFRPINIIANVGAAATVVAASGILKDIVPFFVQKGSLFWLAKNLIVVAVAGPLIRSTGISFKDIPSHYFDPYVGMWDWPRKKHDGGTTQTQKFLDGATEIAGKIKRLIPRPATGMTRSALLALQASVPV